MLDGTKDACAMLPTGNCQHVRYDSKKDQWIIPSGTHCFMSATVSVNSFTGLAATSHPSGVQPPDNLAADLIEMVNSKEDLMQNLIPYLVDRDQKILQHGIKLGKQLKGKE